MKRYYLSKIKKVERPGLGLVNVHRLQEYDGIDYQGGEIAVDQTTGEPLHKALLVLVGGINHAQFAADPELVPLPLVAADTKVSAIHTPTKLAAKSDIVGLGFPQADVDAVWGNADGLRDVINHYGRLNNATFDVNNFDLDES